MKQKYRLFRRSNGVFYSVDSATKKQQSLGTKDKQEALRLVNAKNEAERQPSSVNLQLGHVFLRAGDSTLATRTWQQVMDEMAKCKTGVTRERWERGVREQPFDLIRNTTLVKTRPEQFIQVLNDGTLSTNIFLRRLHNFAIDVGWLPMPLIPRRHWPRINYGQKRGITVEEHEKILRAESNPEWRAYYEVLWHVGGAQTDMAELEEANIDWGERTINYRRRKTGAHALVAFGEQLEAILKSLPSQGPLFPMLSKWPETDRAIAFRRRCRLAGVNGVSLHCYRYAWAERAKAAGMPERFAQEALGQASSAVHRAYAKKAKVLVPSLEQYEKQAAAKVVRTDFKVRAA